jgi:hypothetical protein
MLVAICIPSRSPSTLGLSQWSRGSTCSRSRFAALIIALGLLWTRRSSAADAINREGWPTVTAAHRGVARGATPGSRGLYATHHQRRRHFLPLLLVKARRATSSTRSDRRVVVAGPAMLVAWTFAPLLGFYMLKGQKALGASDGQPARGSHTFTRRSSRAASPTGIARPRSRWQSFWLEHGWCTRRSARRSFQRTCTTCSW